MSKRRSPRARHPVEAYRREGETVLIELRLNEVAQLYNLLDPAPFHEKELDAAADRYLFSAAREIGADKDFKIVVELPQAAIDGRTESSIESAVRNHFAYRLQTRRRDLRHELQRGRTSLVIGLAFLAICMALRELAHSFADATLTRILGEGLLILGWVAMWGPLDIFLYGWWPIAGECRILERLAVIDVAVRPHGA